MIYLDSCALVKLVHPEPQSAALHSWLSAHPGPTVASALVTTEVARAVRRSDPAALPGVPGVLSRLMLIPVDEAILVAAANLSDPLLRTLDAVHLATALALGVPSLAFITYDKRLDAAARQEGLTVVEPT